MKINNDTVKYYNQYHDIIDIPETPKSEPKRTCNVTCVAMITGEDPNDVLDYFLNKYGLQTDKFQWQELLIYYLERAGHNNKAVLNKAAYPQARHIGDDELKQMMVEIRQGRVIFYHKKGHYQIMTGFEIDEMGNMINFIFNDPAGDRKIRHANRTRESGHSVSYSYEMVKAEKIYGMCYSIEI